MSGPTLREQLRQLLAVIRREREYAKALDMEALLTASREKETLLAAIDPGAALDPEARALAAMVRAENRRNAYLFWSTLTWVRESMALFDRQVTPVSYGSQGRVLQHRGGGNLLSGKV